MCCHDTMMLRRAAALAIRGHGGAEPNPLVGCVIEDAGGAVVGEGYHRTCGGPHAEIVALENARDRTDGGCMYVTLEPCSNHGRTPPCTDAIMAAGIKRVVIGTRDAHPDAGGGGKVLEQERIDVVFAGDSVCDDLAAPFLHRIISGLPWVTCKWAQTIDGFISTASGDSQWISGEASRRLVHRERGRVDAVMVGIGTAIQDDPNLTARCPRPRRTPLRVVVDPSLRLPASAKVLDQSAPTIIAHRESCAPSNLDAEFIALPDLEDGSMDLAPLLRHLASEHDAATVLVEGGCGLMSHLFAQHLVNEAWVFTAPLLLGDAAATSPITGRHVSEISGGIPLRLMDSRRRGGDIVSRYRLASTER